MGRGECMPITMMNMLDDLFNEVYGDTLERVVWDMVSDTTLYDQSVIPVPIINGSVSFAHMQEVVSKVHEHASMSPFQQWEKSLCE